jgi:hypothetical protein
MPLLKGSRKKVNSDFRELTFAENHVDTFYKGLNENCRGVNNPLKASTIPLNESGGEKVLKHWV